MRIQLVGFFLMEFLELRWREHIERAVTPAAVVEGLDVLEDRVGELDSRLPSPTVEQLDLHPEQKESIITVEGGPSATDRRHQLRFLQALSEGPGRELSGLNRSSQHRVIGERTVAADQKLGDGLDVAWVSS
jgi:hypothetical protein